MLADFSIFAANTSNHPLRVFDRLAEVRLTVDVRWASTNFGGGDQVKLLILSGLLVF